MKKAVLLILLHLCTLISPEFKPRYPVENPYHLIGHHVICSGEALVKHFLSVRDVAEPVHLCSMVGSPKCTNTLFEMR